MMKYRSHWERVITKFSAVVDKWPHTKRAADAQYTMGLLYENLYKQSRRRDSDRIKAIESFGKVIDNYSQTRPLSMTPSATSVISAFATAITRERPRPMVMPDKRSKMA